MTTPTTTPPVEVAGLYLQDFLDDVGVAYDDAPEGFCCDFENHLDDFLHYAELDYVLGYLVCDSEFLAHRQKLEELQADNSESMARAEAGLIQVVKDHFDITFTVHPGYLLSVVATADPEDLMDWIIHDYLPED